MGARAQFAWLIKGSAATRDALASLSVDLRELQQKVAGLEAAVHDIARAQAHMSERQLDEFDSIRAAVGVATDDLVARVQAVDARTRATL
jgi:hypothetical protein